MLQIGAVARALASAGRFMKALGELLEELVFPSRAACALCSTELGVDFPHNLCPACSDGLAFVGAQGCRCCGRLVGNHALQGLCPHCLTEAVAIDGGASVYIYNDSAQALVHGLKYHEKPWLAPSMAEQMAAVAKALCERHGVEAFVPVPIHGDRLKERGYNQAELLALQLSQSAGAPPMRPILVRLRATAAQNQLDRKARRKNVEGAFAVSPEALGLQLPGCVALVDDVLTTGSTLNACAEALKAAGVGTVVILSYASVPA